MVYINMYVLINPLFIAGVLQASPDCNGIIYCFSAINDIVESGKGVDLQAKTALLITNSLDEEDLRSFDYSPIKLRKFNFLFIN
ncbi:MAG: hypothetical protein EOO87_02495 [Pedobacter sp.]|nr:MAG: hypothetical protein EOO87_02495 [Pedobacter sp.]